MGIGEDFAQAVATRDRAALAQLLAADVDFKGLTPNRVWEATDVDGVVAVYFERWFGPTDEIVRLADAHPGDPVVDTERVVYRLDVDLAEGPHVVEQQAYFRTTAGRISHLRVLCSGYRPRTED